MSSQAKWDARLLRLAKEISTYSKDPSTQVGAVIAKGNEIISTGYNGLPRLLRDDKSRLANRERKYREIIHAEINALIFARGRQKKCTLYTWPFICCSPCASIMIQAGIHRFVAPYSTNERWLADFKLTEENIGEAGLDLVYYDEEMRRLPFVLPRRGSQ